MILYYAMGGGLGHLTRARAVVHTLGVREPVLLLTASPYASDSRIVGNLGVIRVPLAMEQDLPTYRAWLRALIVRLAPTAVYLDVFPAGIQCELCDGLLPAGLPVYHLARLLRWLHYSRNLAGTPPALSTTYLLEPLEPLHLACLRAWSGTLEPLTLVDPPTPLPEPQIATVWESSCPLWLIVHAGGDDEIAELLAYAKTLARYKQADPLMMLIAPHRPDWLPPHIAHLACYPASTLFPLADTIITAGGFNAMRQTEPYRSKHHAMPVPRRFDNQFARVARRHAARPTP